MDRPAEVRRRADLRDELAVERTFLAWIRTGVACMGFGFVVARFGLFLQQLLAIRNLPSVRSYGLSLWLGTALIAAGVIINVISAWHHSRLIRELRRGELPPPRPLTLAVTLALCLAIVGLAMAIYVVSTQGLPRAASGESEQTLMASTPDNGIISKPSNHSVDETVAKLKGILQSKGVTLFALVDHSGEAEKVGMKMPPTKLLIFGSPKAATPLIVAAPSSAIDLPLKILVWRGTP